MVIQSHTCTIFCSYMYVFVLLQLFNYFNSKSRFWFWGIIDSKHAENRYRPVFAAGFTSTIYENDGCPGPGLTDAAEKQVRTRSRRPQKCLQYSSLIQSRVEIQFTVSVVNFCLYLLKWLQVRFYSSMFCLWGASESWVETKCFTSLSSLV